MIFINQRYIVKSGDTLYGISNQFGVSVTELAELNGIKGSFLQVGQELSIPLNSGTNPNNMFMYTVKPGDTLYGIAKKYGVTVDEIMKLNYFTNTILQPGQVIRIPEMYFKEEEMYMPSYINYTVKPGDTLYSIARSNNISIDTLIKDNGLTSNTLSPGQIIRIRTPQIEIEEECYGPSYTPPADNISTITYVVKRGDSLYSIAKKYNTNVTRITNLNNLTTSNLSIGQILKIPSNEEENVYIVKKGDNLYSIARTYNTTVQSIKNKNNLTSNNLSIGQKLII